MSIYDELRPVVKEIMGEFKRGLITLVKITPASGPADDPGAPTETVYSLDAVAKGVNLKFVKVGLAVSTDLMVIAAPVDGVVVTEKDFITLDGVRHKIVEDISSLAAGEKIVWKLIFRKGG
jgi:hypothetical protein